MVDGFGMMHPNTHTTEHHAPIHTLMPPLSSSTACIHVCRAAAAVDACAGCWYLPAEVFGVLMDGLAMVDTNTTASLTRTYLV